MYRHKLTQILARVLTWAWRSQHWEHDQWRQPGRCQQDQTLCFLVFRWTRFAYNAKIADITKKENRQWKTSSHELSVLSSFFEDRTIIARAVTGWLRSSIGIIHKGKQQKHSKSPRKAMSHVLTEERNSSDPSCYSGFQGIWLNLSWLQIGINVSSKKVGVGICLGFFFWV